MLIISGVIVTLGSTLSEIRVQLVNLSLRNYSVNFFLVVAMGSELTQEKYKESIGHTARGEK